MCHYITLQHTVVMDEFFCAILWVICQKCILPDSQLHR